VVTTPTLSWDQAGAAIESETIRDSEHSVPIVNVLMSATFATDWMPGSL
jgi:hypothetical protein